ncbi:EAL_domain [Hexamita inflata]|uniref:EAL domain n=1 Tax=Hexamita inflata TaxID=28002 RepID=A0AA86UM14_9EUKA|nr:EAL domain [Hexamita inflata]
MIYVEDVLMDYVSIDELFISKLDQFKLEAKNAVVAVVVVSIIICICQILTSLVIQKVAPMLQQKQQLKMKVKVIENDDM